MQEFPIKKIHMNRWSLYSWNKIFYAPLLKYWGYIIESFWPVHLSVSVSVCRNIIIGHITCDKTFLLGHNFFTLLVPRLWSFDNHGHLWNFKWRYMNISCCFYFCMPVKAGHLSSVCLSVCLSISLSRFCGQDTNQIMTLKILQHGIHTLKKERCQVLFSKVTGQGWCLLLQDTWSHLSLVYPGVLLLLGTWSHLWYIQGSYFS
jgi:hypothetical protein